jgi:membrane-associated phospholipid phosphatase
MTAELVEKLLTADPEDDDLKWLYSNADEYTPSDLTGKPIPAPGLPQRGEGSPRVWDPRWRRFGVANYILTGASLVIATSSYFVPEQTGRWRARNEFDEWGRRNLGGGVYEDALWARDLSDLFVSVNVSFPLLVDSLIVTSWYRKSSDVATQMALITAEALVLSATIQAVVSGLANRERPYVRECGTEIPANSEDCTNRDRYRSFFSGHTSNAFTAAGVTCMLHAQHAVFGDPLADGLTCGLAMTSATTVGVMRVLGQRHYLSDVMTGAAIGTLSGLGVPWLLHYGDFSASTKTSSVDVRLVPLPNGVAVGGRF